MFVIDLKCRREHRLKYLHDRHKRNNLIQICVSLDTCAVQRTLGSVDHMRYDLAFLNCMVVTVDYQNTGITVRYTGNWRI